MRQAALRLPFVLVALGLLGLSISAYLAATHYGDQAIACAGVGDCNYVNSSEYASIGGVPVSLLGVAMYGGLTAAAILWSLAPLSDRRIVAYWALALAGAGYAGYLTYVEIEILRAICVWCVASAIILTTSLVLATIALLWFPSGTDGAENGATRQHSQPRSVSNQSSYKRRRVSP